jgi:hypothetical protein
MSSRLRMRGAVTISTPQDKLIVQDIVDFIASLEKLGVPATAEIPDGYLYFEWATNKVDVIQCGEHLVSDAEQFDFIVTAHECKPEQESHNH